MTVEQLIERLKLLAAEWAEGEGWRDEYGAGSDSGKRDCADDLLELVAEAEATPAP